MATVDKNFKVKNNIDISNTADTATASSHYIVETASDGIIRPKTLANVKSEILSSAALTGTPTAPTAPPETNTTQIATTAFVTTALSGVAGGASYQTTAPTSPTIGQIWVDSDETPTVLNSNDFALKDSPIFTGTVTLPSTTSIGDVSSTELSYLDGVTSAIQTQLNGKAPLASPALSGTPTAPTAASGTNTTQIATTAFVQSATAALVDSAPTTLDTLNELAAALGDDPNFATTVTNSIAGKQPLDADLTAIAGLSGTSGLLKKTAANTWSLDTTAYTTNTGTVTSVAMTVPTGLSVSGSPITSSGTLAISLASGYLIPTTTAFDAKAPLASPTFTGTVVLPTSTTSASSIRIPHGNAPTSPTDGDIWTTTLGLFGKINGTTEQFATQTYVNDNSGGLNPFLLGGM